MFAVSNARLLAAWDAGSYQKPALQCLVLLDMMSDEAAPGEIRNLTVGERDDRLIRLREELFGPSVDARATCPACCSLVEFGFALADLRCTDVVEQAGAKSLAASIDDYHAEFRLPRADDLAWIAELQDARRARQALLDRCILSATHCGQPHSVRELPCAIIELIVEKMQAGVPQADLQLALTCPECQHAWCASLDIAQFLWHELDAHAHRLFSDVHALACAYGWCETDILALSERRRAAYIELACG